MPRPIRSCVPSSQAVALAVVLAVALDVPAIGCASSSRASFEDEPAAAVGGGAFDRDAEAPKPDLPGQVYGHSDDALYRVNTDTREVTLVGTFQGCSYIADIAIDESGAIYGSTGTELVLVEPNTARCTRIAPGDFPNSLSFVPVGTLDPSNEVLVGYQGGDYVRIDRKSGKSTKIGALGGGLSSSGDIVSTKGGKTYVTVKGPGCDDCLVEIDPTTGAVTKNLGSLGYTDVFGLAFWAGDVYGFTQAGEVLLVKLDADTLVVTSIPIASAPKGLAFWGAGSTTQAPIRPVR